MAASEGLHHDEPLEHIISVPLEKRDILEVFQSHYWVPSSIDLSLEKESFDNLGENDKRSILGIIGFLFNNHETISRRAVRSLVNEIQSPEMNFFFDCQDSMETIHYEMSMHLIKAYIPPQSDKKTNKINKRTGLLISMQSSFNGKKKWIQKWIENRSLAFPVRLFAFAAAERIFISRCMALAHWLENQHPNSCVGLSRAIEFICRDKELNTDFVYLLFRHLEHKPSEGEIRDLVEEAVQTEIGFFQTHFQVDQMNMDLGDVWDHIQSRAETFVEGYKKALEPGTEPDVALEGNAFLNCIQSFANRNILKAAVLPAANEAPLISVDPPDNPAHDLEDWQKDMFQDALKNNTSLFGLAAETGLSLDDVRSWFNSHSHPTDGK